MKIRLDQLLVERGLAQSRTQAAAMIMAGEVTCEGRRLDKPGQTVDADTDLTVAERRRYVSRGGDKLSSVAEILGLDFVSKRVLDIGSSTGGFTDFALQHGAAKVVAVDVGTNQMDWKLRQNPKVELHEQTDIRRFETAERFDIITIDVSFVSLKQVLPQASDLLVPNGIIVAMAKPQFEAGKAVADKYKGVIKDEKVRGEILDGLREELSDAFDIMAEADSGLAGAEGNREHFFKLSPKR